MYNKRIINTERIRRIHNSFSWVDHAFINRGFIKELNSVQILLYLFLVTVGDRHGLSFYHDDTICKLLKISAEQLEAGRQGLISRSLIACESQICQVLDLPDNGPKSKVDSSQGRYWMRKERVKNTAF